MYAVPLICCNFALFKKIKMEENKNKLPEISREELEAAKKAGSGSLCELVSRKALESVGGKLDSESMPTYFFADNYNWIYNIASRIA